MMNVVPLQMFLRSLSRVSLICARSVADTTSSSLTTQCADDQRQTSSELCREYGRRMKTHLRRAETKQVLSLLDEVIEKHQIKPHALNYRVAMQAITNARQRSEADRLYDLVRQDPSMINEIHIRKGLVYMYAIAIGDIPQAEKLADTAPTPHINIYATLMTGYIRRGRAEKAVALFDRIENDGLISQNRLSYTAMINACTKLRDFTRGKEIVQRIVAGNDPLLLQSVNLVTTMIDLLGKAGNHIQLCIRLFNSIQLEKQTSSLVNAMMTAYNKSAMPRETLKLFQQRIDADEQVHDPIHFILVFNACAKLGGVCLKDAHRFYQMMLTKMPSFERHSRCRNAAIDMFGKCADLQAAYEVFDTNKDLNDVVSWGAMLNAYALHGDGRPVLDMFERMQKETTIKINAQIYSTVLNACSHSGLLDEAHNLFRQYGIELPELWKYVTMIDAVARVDQFDEALALINEYELTHPPLMTMYMLVLNCARRRGLVSLAEKTLQRLESFKTFQSEELKTAYVLLANLYNAQGHREDAFKIRQMMREKKLMKIPGLTWVDINGVTYEFCANDRHYNQTHEIYEEVTRIDEELKQDGHIVDSNVVPAGSVHSEKLAMALALISTPPGSSIVLTKNMRICADCHEMIKRLSRLRARKVVFRDSFRYHVFEDGQCSCGDFL